MKGTIRYVIKNYLFLYNKEFRLTNGIFVEQSRNVLILGAEHLKAGSSVQLNRRFRDSLIGKEVEIIKGQWKGYKGRVCKADDKQAIVELISLSKKIPIDRSLIIEVDQNAMTGRSAHLGVDYNDASQGGMTVYGDNIGKTPMQYNTPCYYPHSPHWGAAQSPAFGNTDCKFSTLIFTDPLSKLPQKMIL